MKERDIHNLIEQQNPEAKRRIWEAVSSQIDVNATPNKQQPVPKKKIRMWTAIAAALVCIITLSIVLPLTLGNGEPPTRYCDSTQYTTEEFSQTLKEYSLSHDNDICYVDWYDAAEEVSDEYGHIIGDANNIVFINEFIINGETGEEVTLSVTDNKTQVDIFQTFLQKYDEITVKNTTIRYGFSNNTQFLAVFEYKNYIYYMQLNTADGMERFTNVVENMLK